MHREASTSSTLGVSSTAGAVTRRSSPRKLAMQSMEGSASSPPPSSGSSLQRSESTALVGGASLPPKSPQKDAAFILDAVGIPTPKNAREITNRDESKYEDGYDSDGAIGPFLDAIADQTTKSVLDEDDALPASMLEGGGWQIQLCWERSHGT